eukprot:jgi/Mesvir1/10951/Mv11492-RA.1
MGKYKNPAVPAPCPKRSMPNTDGMPKVPLRSVDANKRKGEGRPYPTAPPRKKAHTALVDKASTVAADMKVSRGEVPATADEVDAARARLNDWLAEGAVRTEDEKMAVLKMDAAVGLQQVALSGVFMHVCAHFDSVLEKCKEMHEKHGRGALLVRVRHISQAERQVVVDWVTADDLKERCFFTYWQAMQHNKDAEIMLAARFSDMSGGDGCKSAWYGKIFTKALAAEWAEMFDAPSIPVRPWVGVVSSPAPVCMGRKCVNRVSGWKERHMCAECRDAVFCSESCSKTSHSCDKYGLLRAGVDSCIKRVDPVFHKGSTPPPFRSPHKWDVSVE